jgi:hypothetical protein
MRCRGLVVAATGTVLLGSVPAATAGMAAPLPIQPQQFQRLAENPLQRLQAISFFLAALLLCALAVQLLWNYLQRDLPKLPRLSYGKAVAVVVLWGLLFIIVLAQISGARELMTPGAWKRDGATYRLADAETSAVRRKERLEHLRTALWHFAATHGGHFPTEAEATTLPAELWEVPDAPGMRYLYVPGRSANNAEELLACEPELESGQRLVLQTNGSILHWSTPDIHRALSREKSP